MFSFCRNNGRLMENMEKGLTVFTQIGDWPKIPQMFKMYLPKPKSLEF